MPGKETAEEKAARQVADGFEGTTELVEYQPRQYEMTSKAGTELITAEEVRQLSFEQVAALFGDSIVTADEAIGTDQYGPILEDKGKLIGVPFIITFFDTYEGDFGKFVSMWVITMNSDRYIVNDGSSGICQQLMRLKAKEGINSGIACKHGLRVSEYDYTPPEGGKPIPAKTFYLDTSL